jgi:hypothetical protein
MPIGFRTGASSDVTAKPLPPQPAALSKRAASAAAASAAAAAADTKLAAVQREMADACNMLDCARTLRPYPVCGGIHSIRLRREAWHSPLLCASMDKR